MRFVNEIHWSTQVSGGASGPYARRAEPPRRYASGFPVEITIAVCRPPGHPGPDGDAIEIEGDAACILDALEEACLMIRSLGNRYVEEGGLHPQWRDRAQHLRREWQAAVEAACCDSARAPSPSQPAP